MPKDSKHQTTKYIQQAALENSVMGLRLINKSDLNAAKTIHEIRVITKRLRAYWRVLQPLLKNNDLYVAHDILLRDAAKLLSQSREDYVNRKLINSFKSTLNNKKDKLVLEKLLKLMPVPEKSEIHCKDKLKSYFIDEQAFWRQFRNHDLIAKVEHDSGVINTYKKAKKLGKKAIKKSLEVEATHQWRKWSKYLFYQLEIVPLKVSQKSSAKYLRQLESLTDILGKLHDMHVLQSIIREYKKTQFLEVNTDNVYQFINKKNQKLAKKIAKNYEQFFLVK